MREKKIAALYVQGAPYGTYAKVPYVDVWDASRDARTYQGPLPVVAHPPCERWGAFHAGGLLPKVRKEKGADEGCFAKALWSVRTWGGVLEHPAGSAAWTAFGLSTPPRRGGWVVADLFGGWTCCVEQGHYGHKARKATWLYCCHVPSPPELLWGPSAKRVSPEDMGRSREDFRLFLKPPKGITREQRAEQRAFLREYEARAGKRDFSNLSHHQRMATPEPFRDLLLSIAYSASPKPGSRPGLVVAGLNKIERWLFV